MLLAFKCFLVAPRAVASFSGNQNEKIPHLLQNTTHIYLHTKNKTLSNLERLPSRGRREKHYGTTLTPWKQISKKSDCLFLNSHQFESTKSLYKFSAQIAHSAVVKKLGHDKVRASEPCESASQECEPCERAMKNMRAT